MIVEVGDRFRSTRIEYARTADQDQSLTYVPPDAVWWVRSVETERGNGIRPYCERVILLMHAPFDAPTVEMWVTPEDLDFDFVRLERG
jgi:hypothetical protein